MTAPSAPDVALGAVTIGAALLLIGSLPVAMVFLRTLRADAPNRSPQVVVQLRRILRVAAIGVAVPALLSLWRLVREIQAATDGTGAAVRQALSSEWGTWTAIRVPVAVVLWFVVAGVLSAPSTTGWISWAAPAGVLAVSLPMTGHAATAGALGVIVDLVHLVSGAIWLSGVVALAVAVPAALRAGTAQRRRQVLLSCAVGFSRLAVLAVAVAVATGVAQPFVAAVDVPSLAGTTWGAAAVTKALLVVAVVTAGLANHRVLIGRLARARSRARVDDSTTLLLGVVCLEVLLGVATVLAAALLVSAPPP